MNVLHIYVPNPDELLNASYLGASALYHVEASADEAGTYLTHGSAVLTAGSAYYTYYDSSGTAGDWYRVRYSNSASSTFTGYETAWQDGGEICKLADARRLLHLDDQDTTADDGPLTRYIRAATDLIHTLTGKRFRPYSATYSFDGQKDPAVLRIPFGVRAITTLKIGDGGTGSTKATLTSTHYAIRPAVQDRAPGEPGTRIELNELCPYSFAVAGQDVIEVVGTFGYADAPLTVRQIAERVVLRAWRRDGAGGPDMGPVDPNSIGWALSVDDKRMLQVYADWPVG